VQPLVENAVKHGIATLAEGGEISLRALWIDGGIRFEIENPYDPDAPAVKSGGIGLRNVRDRLNARYGSAASIVIEPEIGKYKVTLRIPKAEKGANR
jgi:LytS/YehU family sensor histidine kinase